MDYHQLRYLFALLFLLLISFSLTSYSDGPPEGRTGAPGELTCYNGYCHGDFLVNSGPGTVSLTSSLAESGYIPGGVYDITVSVQHSGQKAFGFQLLPYSPETKGGIGLWIETDTTMTQLKTDGDRVYIMHDSAQFVSDSASWHFRWKAPVTEMGEVVFYAAFVAADSSGNRSGDYVYKRNWAISPNLSSAIEKEDIPISPFSVYGTGESRKLAWQLAFPTDLVLQLLDMSGRQVYTLHTFLPSASGEMAFNPGFIPPGIYLLRFQTKDFLQTKKVFLP